MENFPALSQLLMLVLIKLVYYEEILGYRMQTGVVVVAPILIKAIFQCEDGQILIYQILHPMLNGIESIIVTPSP